MSEEHTAEPEVDESPGGVFGNLPDSRPGSRSPRRAGGSASKAKARSSRARAKPRPTADTKPSSAPKQTAAGAADEPPKRDPEREPAPQADGGGGLEDIAWAGVAAAAEAATLGVRLASRAIEALRGNPERD